jgi:uncharacterized membrane protein SirB2
VLADYFAEIRLLHIGSVAVSGSLFAARGLLRMQDSGLANHPAVRYTSYVIDTVLLAAAILLTVILHQYPLVNDWLTAKVVLLFVYVALGSIALKRGRTRTGRVFAFVGALLTFGFIVSVAVTHHPAGWLLWLR